MDKPEDEVNNLFKKYQSLSEEVLTDLELTAEVSAFNEEEKSGYIKAIEKQYTDLEYKITNSETNADKSVVTVNITVYDYYKAQKDAENYMNDNTSEFIEDGIFNSEKLLDLKIKNMMDTKERVEYTLNIDLTKDEKWTIDKLSSETLKKIHGTYNYENN